MDTSDGGAPGTRRGSDFETSWKQMEADAAAAAQQLRDAGGDPDGPAPPPGPQRRLWLWARHQRIATQDFTAEEIAEAQEEWARIEADQEAARVDRRIYEAEHTLPPPGRERVALLLRLGFLVYPDIDHAPEDR